MAGEDKVFPELILPLKLKKKKSLISVKKNLIPVLFATYQLETTPKLVI